MNIYQPYMGIFDLTYILVGGFIRLGGSPDITIFSLFLTLGESAGAEDKSPIV